MDDDHEEEEEHDDYDVDLNLSSLNLSCGSDLNLSNGSLVASRKEQLTQRLSCSFTNAETITRRGSHNAIDTKDGTGQDLMSASYAHAPRRRVSVVVESRQNELQQQFTATRYVPGFKDDSQESAEGEKRARSKLPPGALRRWTPTKESNQPNDGYKIWKQQRQLLQAQQGDVNRSSPTITSNIVANNDDNSDDRPSTQQQQQRTSTNIALTTLTTETTPTGSAKEFCSGRTDEKFEDVYDLGEKLGEGAFGEVYQCKLKKSASSTEKQPENRAVKIIQKEHMMECEYDEVIAEFQMLTALDNPNVIQVYEFYDSVDTFYIVQELAQGGELYDLLAEHGKLPEEDVALLMTSILSCVDYLASRQHIVHRDINLENVLLEEPGNYESLKVIDFGLATKFDEEEGGEKLTALVGKARYLAPEVLGDVGYGPKYDVWSCGVITYILLSGMFPFDSDNDADVYHQIVDGYVSYDGPEWEPISDEAKAFVGMLLTYDEEARPTAGEALRHPWITNTKNSDAVPAAQVWCAPHSRSFPKAAAASYDQGLQSSSVDSVTQHHHENPGVENKNCGGIADAETNIEEASSAPAQLTSLSLNQSLPESDAGASSTASVPASDPVIHEEEKKYSNHQQQNDTISTGAKPPMLISMKASDDDHKQNMDTDIPMLTSMKPIDYHKSSVDADIPGLSPMRPSDDDYIPGLAPMKPGDDQDKSNADTEIAGLAPMKPSDNCDKRNTDTEIPGLAPIKPIDDDEESNTDAEITVLTPTRHSGDGRKSNAVAIFPVQTPRKPRDKHGRFDNSKKPVRAGNVDNSKKPVRGGNVDTFKKPVRAITHPSHIDWAARTIQRFFGHVMPILSWYRREFLYWEEDLKAIERRRQGELLDRNSQLKMEKKQIRVELMQRYQQIESDSDDDSDDDNDHNDAKRATVTANCQWIAVNKGQLRYEKAQNQSLKKSIRRSTLENKRLTRVGPAESYNAQKLRKKIKILEEDQRKWKGALGCLKQTKDEFQKQIALAQKKIDKQQSQSISLGSANSKDDSAMNESMPVLSEVVADKETSHLTSKETERKRRSSRRSSSQASTTKTDTKNSNRGRKSKSNELDDSYSWQAHRLSGVDSSSPHGTPDTRSPYFETTKGSKSNEMDQSYSWQTHLHNGNDSSSQIGFSDRRGPDFESAKSKSRRRSSKSEKDKTTKRKSNRRQGLTRIDSAPSVMSGDESIGDIGTPTRKTTKRKSEGRQGLTLHDSAPSALSGDESTDKPTRKPTKRKSNKRQELMRNDSAPSALSGDETTDDIKKPTSKIKSGRRNSLSAVDDTTSKTSSKKKNSDSSKDKRRESYTTKQKQSAATTSGSKGSTRKKI